MKKNIKVFISCCFIFLLNTQLVRSQHHPLYINEFMASNATAISDAAGEYDDWIEIYNDNEYPVNLSGFYLTDNLDNPTKWALPDISIAAKAYLLIWADDITEQGDVHTNFKLSAEGEQIGLYDGSKFIDSLTFSQQITDISCGRYPDGGINWVSFSEPTPNAPNYGSIIEFAEAPNFSSQGGFYSDPVTVELGVTSPNATIYYTLDCYEPTKQSLLYTGPILINKTTVIRARAYEDGHYPSEIRTHSYILDNDFEIATLSLVTDPPNLWDIDSGIYMNPNEKGDNWERPVAVEFYEPNNQLCFSANAGIRISGEASRKYDKKAFRLYFQSEYGRSWLEYLLFPSKSQVARFKRLSVHAGSTDMPANPYGHGWTLVRDPLMYELGRRAGCIYPANQPVALFLNGDSWGIYHFMERIDKYFTESNFGELDVDLIENNTGARDGDMIEWNRMISFFENHNLSHETNFEMAKSFIDIQNFINYQVLEIFGGNGDWTHHNVFAFRLRSEGSVWRWILWDMDGCFGPYVVDHNTLQWATRDDPATFILRKLFENTNYRNLFINRFADLLNTTFLTSNVKALIDSLAAVIRNDITFETDKWGSSPNSWEQDGIYGELYNFAENRPDIVRDHIKEKFSLSGTVNLTIELPQNGYGKIKINSIHISEYPWSGIYYKKIPTPLAAIPNPGYHFVGWSDSTLPQQPEIALVLQNDYQLAAIFQPDSLHYEIVINEINYNSSDQFDPGDWIELYNPNKNPVDLTGWQLSDETPGNRFIFPAKTIIAPDGYLIVCQKKRDFHDLFPLITSYIGDMNFGLSSQCDEVIIFNPLHVVIDSVRFDVSHPWPVEANGTGATLELLASQLDNTLARNWQASAGSGSPGKPTLALPVVKHLVATDNSGSNLVTQSRDVLIGMEGHDFDGHIAKWLITETELLPSLQDFVLTSAPLSYHIQGNEGSITLFGWLLDNDNQISRLTDSSRANILLVLRRDRFSISGKATYLQNKKTIPDMEVKLTESNILINDTTDSSGSFSFHDLYPGTVRLETMKSGDARDAVSCADALLILYHLGNMIKLSRDAMHAADATEDGKISEADVQAILHFRAFDQQNSMGAGRWRAIPRDTTYLLNANSLTNFQCYLLGDVNLNWGLNDMPGDDSLTSRDSIDIIVQSYDVTVQNKQFVKVPIVIRPKNESIHSLVFSLHYDPRVLQFSSFQKSESLNKFLVEVNANDPGEIHVALVGIEGIKSDKVLFEFSFLSEWSANVTTEVELIDVAANDLIVKNVLNGKIFLSSPDAETAPTNFELFQNYPNPFNQDTQINFQIPSACQVKLIVYNLSGERIKTIVNEIKPAGKFRVFWDGRADNGASTATGIYILKMQTERFEADRKMILLK